jgi:hypothetical protein
MTARELVDRAFAAGPWWQRYVNAFVDAFRSASPEERVRLVAEAPEGEGEMQGLVAAVVSALCRETGTEAPEWVRVTASPRPFFAFPAEGYAMRVRLMLESPPAFRIRRVFVPASYLDRA